MLLRGLVGGAKLPRVLALALSAAGAAAFNKMPTGAPQQRCSLLVSGCTPALLKALPTGVRKALPQEGSTVTGVIYEIETQRALQALLSSPEGAAHFARSHHRLSLSRADDDSSDGGYDSGE